MTAIISLQFHNSISADASNIFDESEKMANSDAVSGRINLSREELDIRLRLVIERSIEAVSLRGESSTKSLSVALPRLSLALFHDTGLGSSCSDIEKFFVRTLLHTLFLNSVGQDSSGRWLPLVNPFRKFLRSKLSLLVVMVLSPLYSITDRVQFALWISQSIPVNLSSCLSHKQLHIVHAFSPSICNSCSPEERDIITRCLTFKHRNRAVDINEWLQTLEKTKNVAASKVMARHENYFSQFTKLSNHVVEIAASVTQSYVHEQNQERVKFFNKAKEQERRTYATKKKWKTLVQSVSHEAHYFYDEASFPQNWQLDPSEGPSRMRRKLMRCHLDIESRFFDEGFRNSSSKPAHPPLASLYDATDKNTEVSILIDSIHANEQILLTYNCALVTPEHEYTGELLLSDTGAHFIGTVSGHSTSESPALRLRQETWLLADVKEFLERRYQLQDTALELFLENGNSYLLALTNSSDMRNIAAFLSERGISQTTEMKSLTGVTRLWREKVITNFDVSNKNISRLMCNPSNLLYPVPDVPEQTGWSVF